MTYAVRVDVFSRDAASCVGSKRHGALAAAGPRSRSIKGRDIAVVVPDESVIHAVVVNILSYD